MLHLWGPHQQPRLHLRERFRLVGQALVGALTSFGVPDARIGPVPGEYCDGAWSVNVAARARVAGTGQRLCRHDFLFCAAVTLTEPERVTAMLVDAYPELGLPLEPLTVGSVSQWVPGVRFEDAREAVAGAIGRAVADVAARPVRGGCA